MEHLTSIVVAFPDLKSARNGREFVLINQWNYLFWEKIKSIQLIVKIIKILVNFGANFTENGTKIDIF